MSNERPIPDNAEQYWAERTAREYREARRERRRERRLYSVGMTGVWAASVIFAFGVGYSQARPVTGAAALLGGWIVIGLLVGSVALMSANGRGQKVWIEDPGAADRWREDLEQEKLKVHYADRP